MHIREIYATIGASYVAGGISDEKTVFGLAPGAGHGAGDAAGGGAGGGQRVYHIQANKKLNSGASRPPRRPEVLRVCSSCTAMICARCTRIEYCFRLWYAFSADPIGR